MEGEALTHRGGPHEGAGPRSGGENNAPQPIIQDQFLNLGPSHLILKEKRVPLVS